MPQTTDTGAMRTASRTKSAFFWRSSSSSAGVRADPRDRGGRLGDPAETPRGLVRRTTRLSSLRSRAAERPHRHRVDRLQVPAGDEAPSGVRGARFAGTSTGRIFTSSRETRQATRGPGEQLGANHSRVFGMSLDWAVIRTNAGLSHAEAIDPCGHFPLVRRERRQQASLLLAREGPRSDRACDPESGRRPRRAPSGEIRTLAIGLLRPEARTPRLRSRARDRVHPRRSPSHERRAWTSAPGSLSSLLVCPFIELRVLRCLADDGVIDRGIAEMVDHGSDRRTRPAQPFVQARLCPSSASPSATREGPARSDGSPGRLSVSTVLAPRFRLTSRGGCSGLRPNLRCSPIGTLRLRARRGRSPSADRFRRGRPGRSPDPSARWRLNTIHPSVGRPRWIQRPVPPTPRLSGIRWSADPSGCTRIELLRTASGTRSSVPSGDHAWSSNANPHGVTRRRSLPSARITNSAPDPVGLTPSWVSKKLRRVPSGRVPREARRGPATSRTSPPPSEARTE